MKKYLIFTCIAVTLAFFSTYLVFIPKKALTEKKSSYVCPERLKEAQVHFKKALKQEEAQLIQKLSSAFAIDPALLQADYSQQWRQGVVSYQSNDSIKTLAYEVAQAFDINISKLNIIQNRTDGGSPAYSNDTELVIEMNLFPEFCKEVQKFIIAHELQHILNADCAQLRVLKRKINGVMSHAQTQLFEAYNKFQEKRADFNAALQGIEWAEGYLAFAQEGLKRCKSGAGNLHPTWQERVNWAQDIVNHMKTIKTV